MPCLSISVVIPCYNRRRFIGDAIQSVLDQAYPGDLEILVSDDGSTDDSREIVRSYGPPVRLVERPSSAKARGPAVARNRAIEVVRNDIVAFMDSDDVYYPGYLRSAAEFLQANPDVDLVFGNLHVMDADGRRGGLYAQTPSYPSARTIPLETLLELFVPCNTVLVRKRVLDKVGSFNEDLYICEDKDLWLRIAENGGRIVYLPVSAAYWRQHGDQTTAPDQRRRVIEAMVQCETLARQRHAYPPRALRRTLAMRHFMLAKVDLRDRKIVPAFGNALKSLISDPSHIVMVARGWCSRRRVR